MNDDFLTRFTKPPRPEFAAELYRRINPPATARPSFAVRAALAASALCAVLAATLLVSPAARAAVLSLIRDIGGVSFQETSDYPGSGDITTVPEEILSLEDAQVKLPYSISLPTWVPEGIHPGCGCPDHPFYRRVHPCDDHLARKNGGRCRHVFRTHDRPDRWIMGRRAGSRRNGANQRPGRRVGLRDVERG